MTSHRRDEVGSTPAVTEDDSVKQKAAEAKQQAADTAQAGKQAATDVASTATDAAKDVAQETSQQARDLLGKTKTQVNEQVSTQQTAVVENLRSLGDQLAEMTDHVEHQGTAVDLATSARDQVRSAADWLDGRDPADVLDELRKLGRNKPGAFLLGAAVAGVVAGRLTRGVVAVHTDDEPGAVTGPGSGDRAITAPMSAEGTDRPGVRPRPAGVSGNPMADSFANQPGFETGGAARR